MKKAIKILVILSSFILNAQNYVLDSTFANNGVFLYGSVGFPKKVIFENNKYYIVGSGVVACVNYDGTMNSNFGTNGFSAFTTSNNYVVNGAKFYNNYIYVFGYINGPNTDFFIAKISLSGVLDPSFGINGIVVQSFGGTYEELKDILFLNNGKILCVGDYRILDNWGYPKNPKIFISRYNNDGSIDASFDTNAFKILPINNADKYTASNILTYQNSIMIVGSLDYTYSAGNPTHDCDMLLVNIDENANIITSFGTNGIIRHHLLQAVQGGISSAFNAKLINNTDLYFIKDYSFTSGTTNQLMRYNLTNNNIENLCYLDYSYHNYTVDTTNQKIYTTSIPNCGSCWRDFKIYRKNMDGTTDTTFNSNGYFVYNFPYASSDDNITAHFIHDDGRVLLVGNVTGIFVPGYFGIVRIIDQSLSLNANNLSEKAGVYPNPVEDFLNLELNTDEEVEEISIYDMTGKVVFYAKEWIPKINVSELKEDVYFIKIRTTGTHIIQKFIKK